MKAPQIPLILLVVGALVLSAPGCKSVDNLVESGNYEQAISLAQRKLTGKDKKNPKFVAALEQAVNRANERDMERAEFMQQKNGTDWTRVHAIYDNIKRRQDALRPLLPLYDKNGRKATFRFVRAEELVVDAEDRAADQLYAEAVRLLAAGRSGDKAAAREAWSTFETVERYRPDHLDSRQLALEAEALGRVYVAVELANESQAFLPRGFEEELLRIQTAQMDDRWHVYNLSPADDGTYDYRARLVIRDIDVSPERLSERSYTEEKEVTDGEEYVLDDKGNVAKDSLGNDIKQPRIVRVSARVVEVLQQKTAIVSGSMQLYDVRQGRVVDDEELTAEARFENYASTFNGDKRALSRESRQRIGNTPRQFPSDEQLVLDAASVLKPILQQRLADSRKLI
ncbi:hypothetical protein CLV84_3362 [Neolewinella xylanilytica]|uniref:Uncharacterized protein n=1 Tax=Neolewinella xylanilytica TaxID=1514080 RepID=A0A2S6I5K4_9BACT|nr:hypothetical protein [Neolewinella xylanilytica]PPK86435.1 hypothetical protein CLV84_3362 [Neolewinella xylanilytica]